MSMLLRALALIGLFHATPLLAGTITVLPLEGAADSGGQLASLYFEGRDVGLELSHAKGGGGLRRLTVYAIPMGDDGNAEPQPQVILAEGDSFDSEAVYLSDDQSLLWLAYRESGQRHWLVFDARRIEELARLPAGQLAITGDQLTISDPPPALAEAVAAYRPLDPWQRLLWPQHESRVMDARAIANEWRQTATAGADFEAEGRALLAELLDAPVRPIRRQDLPGQWRVRSLQASSLGVFLYPWFKATIEPVGATLRLRKTSGSQRRLGLLYPSSAWPDALVFLGGSSVNDDLQPHYSRGPDGMAEAPWDSDSAGLLYQLAPDRLLMILDADWEGQFELYELRR